MFEFFQQKLRTNLKISRMIGALEKSMILNLGKFYSKYSNKYVKVLSCLCMFFYASLVSYYSQCNTINFSVTVTSDFNGSPTSCPNACDAELTVAVSSSGGPFGYTLTEQSTGISTIQSNPIFTNLCGSGNYTITVTDTAQEVIPGMIKNKWGRIINITSIGGQWGGVNQVHYASAKAGLIGLTMSLARIYSKSGITSNSISPGIIDTEMTSSINQSEKETHIEHIPSGRFGIPSEVAEAVSFLASNNSAYITGQTINVNGGMLRT